MPNIFGKTLYDIDPPAFGLDLSDFTVKVVMLKKQGSHLGLSSFAKETVPQGTVVGGIIEDPGKAATAVRKAIESVKGERIKTKYAVCSLPEEKAFIRVIQLPKMKPEEMAEAVKWETENNIPMTLEEVYLDWQVIQSPSNNIDHIDVLIVAVPRIVVDGYVDVFKKAGVTPRVLEVESVAIARSVIRETFSPEPVFILDLGQARTSFLIFSGSTLRFTSSVEISSQGFSDLITRGLKVSIEEAEELKIRSGLDRKAEGGKVFECLVPVITDLAEQVRNYLSFYQEHAQHEHLKKGITPGLINKIILCGGGANLIGLDSFLGVELKMTVERVNPWINILKPPLREVPELSYEHSLAYTTALGLALRGIQRF